MWWQILLATADFLYQTFKNERWLLILFAEKRDSLVQHCQDGVERGRLRGHLHQSLKTLKELELFHRQQDIGGSWFWDNKLQVQEEVLPPPNSIRCYVRGCKLNDKIGWGCHILDNSVTYNVHGSLGIEATSSQAEIHAISQAARSLSLKEGGDIYFLTAVTLHYKPWKDRKPRHSQFKSSLAPWSALQLATKLW